MQRVLLRPLRGAGAYQLLHGHTSDLGGVLVNLLHLGVEGLDGVSTDLLLERDGFAHRGGSTEGAGGRDRLLQRVLFALLQELVVASDLGV